MSNLLDILLHVDEHLQKLISTYGFAAHGILFAVIFLETGLIIMPFLPGDSLLFAAGLYAHPGKGFNLMTLLFGLPLASILGDSVNFHIGKWVGARLFKPNSRFFKSHWLEKTRAFYEKHGAKTIILGRFVPIVRTVAPFVAGMEIMPYRKYLPLCILGSFLWVWICVGAGYFLGNIPWVEHNFEYVILGVIFLSILAIVKEVAKERKSLAKANKESVATPETANEMTENG